MMLYHKFQFIYIPVSFQSLGNPQLMSIYLLSDLTFFLPNADEHKLTKASGCYSPYLTGSLLLHSKQPRTGPRVRQMFSIPHLTCQTS